MSICLGYSGSHSSDGVNVQYNKNKTTLSCTRGKTFLFQFVVRKYSRGDTKQREIVGLQKSFLFISPNVGSKKVVLGSRVRIQTEEFLWSFSQRRLTMKPAKWLVQLDMTLDKGCIMLASKKCMQFIVCTYS